MKMRQAVEVCFRKYVDFSGRASRSEYWLFTAFTVIVAVILIAIDVWLWGWNYSYGVADIWALLVLLPALAAIVRRLHDCDWPGWWAFILLIPLVGQLLMIVWTAAPGQTEANRFGPAPH